MTSPTYETWSCEELISRLRELDKAHPTVDPQVSSAAPRNAEAGPSKLFDMLAYPRRKIALKFCYSGWEYNGLVIQNDKTRLPTVEGTLYNALASCKLIDGAAGPQACGWERCGRTDVGVSSAAQVVSLWVRSNIGQADEQTGPPSNQTESSSIRIEDGQENPDSDFLPDPESELPQLDASEVESAPLPAIHELVERRQELRYLTILNRILPPSIRIIAWSPVSSSFSSRFNCKHRHYKYFFSPEGLSIDAMRDAAARLVGDHDFRNLCKLDPSKQLTVFRRNISRADISPASVLANDDLASDRSHMYVFDLIGNAFLYNQVRHIMAILLLVGAGLEPPCVMTSLLNADPERPEPPFLESDPPPELVTCKPEYQMADPLPLVLWECAYDDKDVKWQTDSPEKKHSAAANNLYQELHAIHTRSLIHSALDATFLKAASAFHPAPQPSPSPSHLSTLQSHFFENSSKIVNVLLGGGMVRRIAGKNYIPLLRRKRLDHVNVVNERWRNGKGRRKAAKQVAVADVEDE
ncbi:tRNA pseudouridine synthase [Fomitiporia mediterranea MF3/22]|uniref:tRNA pseudouridine synthase n=1 Tax=Fomitiporia mediterranea (strain MF3/22) TaxID=694068 RepID=UPI00044098EB|nr:tRNA pseudouridine synthase [Fomitiporia mediterranea MF3/22]EJD05002.1 tRNA pseudouridine synthase [Fomitiporia mediterranea MF3/22]